MQVALMSLKPGEDIPREVHNGDQVINILSGHGVAEIGKTRKLFRSGNMLVIPAGKSHYIKNTGREPLKLYTIYSPPEH